VAKATEASDLNLLQSDTDFPQTGLKVNSAIRLHRLVTIPVHLIQKQLGYLPASRQKLLDEKLRELFDL
ncbi:MAG: type II toxin-antitoxin system PemK/MazF family toxin, partial [Bacteroidetes bacterium]|nr:type II toxin-antitoxin system PemK/MazF family toxin [Bacteroidota bacterium]